MSIIISSGSPLVPPRQIVHQPGYCFEDEDSAGFVAKSQFIFDLPLTMLEGGALSFGHTDELETVVLASFFNTGQSLPLPNFGATVTDSDEYYNGDGDDDGYTARGNYDLSQCDLGVSHYVLSGVTRDSTSAVLPACVVHLMDTATDVLQRQSTSDATTGSYSFSVYYQGPFYITAYKAGAPDVAGTTVNTLTPAPQ